MIRKISGSLERVEPTAIELAVGSIVHEVLVPDIGEKPATSQTRKSDIPLHA